MVRRKKLINKEEEIKQILSDLLATKKGYFSREDIEKSIIRCRGCIDKRTVGSWFTFLWKMEYFVQPQPHIYNLNLQKVADLELAPIKQIDKLQKRLGDFEK